MLTYCSQVKYKGAVRRHQKNVHRLPPSLSRPLSELDFCLRPIPHLGACSQASRQPGPHWWEACVGGKCSTTVPSLLPQTLLFVSAIALLSWFPVIIINYLRFESYIISPTIFFTAVALHFSNSFVNPIAYALRIPAFRQALRFTCFGRQEEINMEGDKRRENNRVNVLMPTQQFNALTTDPVIYSWHENTTL